MLKTIISVDLANINIQVLKEGRRLDIISLRDYLTRGREGYQEMLIYTPHSNEPETYRFIDFLKYNNFLVYTKTPTTLPDGSTKCNMDIEMAMDAIELCIYNKPEEFVLVSGDGDFAEMCHRLRRHGVRVMVASLEKYLSNELKKSVPQSDRPPAVAGKPSG